MLYPAFEKLKDTGIMKVASKLDYMAMLHAADLYKIINILNLQVMLYPYGNAHEKQKPDGRFVHLSLPLIIHTKMNKLIITMTTTFVKKFKQLCSQLGL